MAIPKLSLRAVLISTSVLFAAVILKISVPTIIQFASSEVFLTWLRPPYLYLVINCIIITIVASSKLQNNKVVEDSSHEAAVVLPAPVKVEAGYAEVVYDGVDGKRDAVEVPPVSGYGYGEVVVKGEDFGVGGEVDGGGYAAVVYDGVDGKSDAVDVPPVFGYGYGEVVVKGEDFGVGGEVDGGGYAAAVYDGVDGKSDAVDVPPVFGYGYGKAVVKGEDFGVGGEVDGGMKEVESDRTTTLDLIAPEDVSGQDEVAVSTSLSSRQVNSATEYLVSSYERPPVSGRIGHRKGVKSSPEGGRTLGVSKPKRHETLENTWKTITEGRSMPLARHLRKSDTWETHNRVGHLQEEVHDQMMIKSETFNDRSTASPMNRPPVRLLREPSGLETFNDRSTASPVNRQPVRLLREPSWSGKLKKESSPSKDELNRRVEAFIKKFNEEMRLQRQESLKKYKEMMINRGSH